MRPFGRMRRPSENGARETAELAALADGSLPPQHRAELEARVARVFAHPFIKSGIEPLQGLGFGVAGTYGNQEGALRSFNSPGQQRIFAYSATTVADGDHWRVAPQAYWYWGPFVLFGEYIVSNQEVVNGAAADQLEHSAWQVAASYVLTGEKNSWRGITPKRPFSPRDGGWGRVATSGRLPRPS